MDVTPEKFGFELPTISWISSVSVGFILREVFSSISPSYFQGWLLSLWKVFVFAFGLFCLLAMDEVEVAEIDDTATRLAEDEDGISAVDGIGQEHEAASY